MLQDSLRHRPQVPHQPDARERGQHVVADIDLPPREPLPHGSRVVVVVVVPPLTEGQQRDERVVAAVVGRLEATRAEAVRE